MANQVKFSFIQWTAWRYLVARKGRHGLSFMTTFSILGVTIGVAALIIVLSVMGGFENDIKGRMLKGQPHLEILAKNAIAGFSLKDHPVEQFEKLYPDAKAIAPFIQSDVVIKQGKHLSSAQLFGIDPARDSSLWAVDSSMTEGKLLDIAREHKPLMTHLDDASTWPGIVLGESLASQLGANVGDEVVVLSTDLVSSSTLIGGGTLTRSYVVVGLFRTGQNHIDSKWAVVSLPEGRKFMPEYDASLDDDEFVTGVAVNSPDPTDMDGYVEAIEPLEDLQAKTWQSANSALLFALQLEKYTMGSILLLIVIVAAFSISGTMMMMVFHKKQQICLLRSLGMTEKDVRRLYLVQGMTIGTVGIILGLLLGLSVCVLLKQLHYADLPSNLLSLRSLPVRFLPVNYAVICAAAWLLSVLAAFYPAAIAARQNPSQGLRYS